MLTELFDQQGTATSRLKALCKELGQKSNDLAFIRQGTNVIAGSKAQNRIYRIHCGDDPAIVKDHLLRAQALYELGSLVVPPLLDEPAVDNELVVTVWPRGKVPEQVDACDMGRALASIHEVHLEWPLEPIQLSPRIQERLKNLPTSLPEDVRQILHDHAESAFKLLEEGIVEGDTLLHSDAHLGNAVIHEGRLKLIDLDDLCIGRLEYDLVPGFMESRRFGGTRESFEKFKDGYGGSPDWDLVADLSDIREVTMNTWLAGLWNTGFRPQQELLHRVRTWDDPVDEVAPWKTM